MAYEGGGGQMGLPGGKNGNGNGKGKVPTLTKKKGVGYNATTSDQIFAISSVAGATTKESMPKSVEIENSGRIPLVIMAGYETYSDDTSDGVTEYLHTLLPPGEVFNPPLRAVIRTGESTVLMDGTAVDNAAPDSNEYVDSTADVDSATADGIVNSTSATTLYLEPYTSAANCTANLFRVGDLIRIRDEVMEVTAIGDKSNLANNTLTVKRGMYASTAVTAGADDDPVRLPFFNAYHDYADYTVAQTDRDGKFKCFNFFGLGRSATEVQGIVPGSVALKFYTEGGYQELGMSGITSGTHSGLTASTAYAFDIQVDGGTNFDNLTFTTDSSNLNFGGTNGVINKIQSALDTQYYTSGNLFQKKVYVGIVNGNIRFTSGSNLSTSAIALTAEDGADASFFGSGRIPALIGINAAVAARLPDDVIYDNVTYATAPNTKAFMYDDGNGNLFGVGTGKINYETGAVDFHAPVEAEFVISCLHTSAFSGRVNESETDRINSLVDIYANTTNQKWTGEVKVKTY